ncbi:MAG: histone H1 [Ignavibacteriae bacterium]|nr:histone H1 [Ignavibacteriota bacterium]
MKKSESDYNRFQELLQIVKSFENNFLGFYKKGNKAAGIRLRKNMQMLRAFAKNIRFEVQDMRKNKNLKTTKRKNKDQISIFQ